MFARSGGVSETRNLTGFTELKEEFKGEKQRMLTEYETRQRMDEVQKSDQPPLRKARVLLRLGRSLRGQAESLNTDVGIVQRQGDRNVIAGMRRLANRTVILQEDIRRAAHAALLRVRRRGD